MAPDPDVKIGDRANAPLTRLGRESGRANEYSRDIAVFALAGYPGAGTLDRRRSCNS
jgi:hypothetical protein